MTVRHPGDPPFGAVDLQSADHAGCGRLRNALMHAMSGATDAHFAISPYTSISRAELDPRATSGVDLPNVEDRSVYGVLRKLEAAGLVTTRTVLYESPTENYLTDGRSITAVEVHRPFAVLSVRYSWSPSARWTGPADRWEITDRSYIVPAGADGSAFTQSH